MTEENARATRRVAIRRATAGDYDRIVDLWRKAGLEVSLKGRDRKEAYLKQLARFPTLYLVAADGDKVVGVVFGSHDGRKGWINRLAVLPDCQRSGIAAALVAECDALIRACGIDIVATLVDPENASSRALFEKLGYRADVPVVYYRKRTRADA